MNKKISTLFTAGLLVAGSLCGSAWAKQVTLPMGSTPLTELKAGQEVFMSLDNILYGFDSSAKTPAGENTGAFFEVKFGDADNDPKTPDVVISEIEENELADYIWVVSFVTGASETSYTFTNKATGDVLRIAKDGSKVEYDTAVKDENTISLLLFDDGAAYKYTPADATATPPVTEEGSGVLSAYKADKTLCYLTWDVNEAQVATSDPNKDVLFYAVDTSVLGEDGAKELNALYNGSGFSFGVKTPDTKELIGNLFGDQRIVAVYNANPINVDNSSNPTYVSQQIPVGMYFFTENAPIKADGSAKTDYASWMNATAIVASPTETVEATVADRQAGQGYGLTTMKIKDMNLYVKDTDPEKEWMSQGNEVSILNACFTVNKTYVGSYPYALTIDNFRYKAKDSEAAHTQKAVRLNVIGHSTNNYLATQVLDDPQFIFNLAASGMIDGIDLLNKEAKAAVYSIRVLDGMGDNSKAIDKEDVKSAYGKYMTVGEASGNFRFVAKAKVLAMENTPAYQWVITEVKNNDVTFTNRETDESFTAKLFPVEGQENVYELAVSRVNDDNGTAEAAEVAQTNVTPIYVDQNTYNEAAGSVSAKLDKLVIELKPVEVDPYAGFLNVDNKTLVTMAFARDNNETSNKWYAAINEDGEFCAEDHNGSSIYPDNYFVTEASDAAQWQLIKSKSAKKIVERSFVYNDNGHVTVKAKADVAYAYQYKLQYITDG